MPLHRLYGLTVQSDFPIPAAEVEAADPDITVVSGRARAVPDGPPPGTILAEMRAPWPVSYVARDGQSYVIRYPGVCEARVDTDLAHVELSPANDEARGLSHILFSGSILARILTLMGECILHASAVRADRRAIGFVGHSGAGKSTLAALMCSSGSRLITDDLLRLLPRDGGFECIAGTNAIRLRPAAVPLASFVPGTVREEADGRTSITVVAPEDRPPLGVLVFPQPSRSAHRVEVTALDPGDALMALTGSPRTLGWTAPDILESMFRWNARLVREVPVCTAEIPWGPPFDPSVAPALRSALDPDPALTRGAG